MAETDYSDSGFIVAGDVSALWQEITPLQRRRHSVLYRGKRYGRWFVLKGLTDEQQPLTDFRLLQEREFRLGIQLVHPNIVATYSLEYVADLGRCIVMEAVDGQTLDCWLAARPNRQKRRRVLMQLLDAVEYLHARQLVHHDLKPGNILITRNGENVKLIDFGLSDSDDSATPAPNDIQDDLLRLAALIDLLHLRGYRSIAHACRKGRYKNIAELRKGISAQEKWGKVGTNILVLIATVLTTLGIWQMYNRPRLHYADLYNQQQQMSADIIRCQHKEQERLEGILRQAPKGNFLHYQQLLDQNMDWQSVRDSLASVYAGDSVLQNQCIILFNEQQALLVNHLYDVIQELTASPDQTVKNK